MKLKKGQGNNEGDFKTQLQIEGNNMRVKDEKALMQRFCDHKYWFVSIKKYVYIHICNF